MLKSPKHCHTRSYKVKEREENYLYEVNKKHNAIKYLLELKSLQYTRENKGVTKQANITNDCNSVAM